jgi:hypothetical protein
MGALWAVMHQSLYRLRVCMLLNWEVSLAIGRCYPFTPSHVICFACCVVRRHVQEMSVRESTVG